MKKEIGKIINTTYEYDNKGKLIKSIEDDSITRYYNNNEQITKVEYPNGEAELYDYDNKGKLIKSIDDSITRYYNNNGQITKVEYPNGEVALYDYDEKGNPIKSIRNGKISAEANYKNGLLLSRKTYYGENYSNYNYEEYKYDNKNREIYGKTDLYENGALHSFEEFTKYDDDKNIKTCIKNDITVEVQYDDKNRVVKEIWYHNHKPYTKSDEIDYEEHNTYKDLGAIMIMNREYIQTGDLAHQIKIFDNTEEDPLLLESIDISNDDFVQYLFEYDNNKKMTREIHKYSIKNKLSKSITIDYKREGGKYTETRTTIDQEYDEESNSYKTSTNTDILSTAYYDKNNNVIKEELNGGIIEYEYDKDNKMIHQKEIIYKK